jgi:DNA-binding response OmpR family regulator
MKLKILLIEDDLDDIELLQDACLTHGVSCIIEDVNDGSEALEYIRLNKGTPDIIILDMNLPKIHGRDIIPVIRNSKNFAHIPLLILTTSSSADDIEYAYKNGASKYMKKPATVDEIRETVKMITELAENR